MTERERELWENCLDFVERCCPDLDIRCVHEVAEKIYRKMNFATKLPKVL